MNEETVDNITYAGVAIVIGLLVWYGVGHGWFGPINEPEFDTTCINGECGFKMACVNEVTVELANEMGVRVLDQRCLQKAWVKDTEFAEELLEAGLREGEVRFD